MATSANTQDIQQENHQECFKCKAQVNLKKENITEEKSVIICKECYECNKCSICCELFESESFKLHDDFDCCTEVKLCKICRDHLRYTNITGCPVCKKDPSPPQQEQQLIQYVNLLSREYNYINPHSYEWISHITGREPHLYYFKNVNVEILLEHFLEDKIINFGDRFYSYQFQYIQNEDRLLMKIDFYCSSCPNIHYKVYEFVYVQEDDSILEGGEIVGGGGASVEEVQHIPQTSQEDDGGGGASVEEVQHIPQTSQEDDGGGAALQPETIEIIEPPPIIPQQIINIINEFPPISEIQNTEFNIVYINEN